jgi:hypothetical protein
MSAASDHVELLRFSSPQNETRRIFIDLFTHGRGEVSVENTC